jgi:chemotaxis regulatin CheY-phosphate phosphatase CheZ
MKQNRLTFESKNLVVDWVSFKFQSLEDNDQRKIVHYLSKLGFDSYQKSGKLANPIKESILVSSANQFEVLFSKKGLIGRAPHFTFLAQMLSVFIVLFKKN